MDTYLPSVQERIAIVKTQIAESRVIIYRNNLENLTFIQKNDEDKQTEVNTNNKILQRKIDLLSTELKSLEAQVETGSSTTK